MATWRASWVSKAFQTSPIPPRPKRSTSSYLPRRCADVLIDLPPSMEGCHLHTSLAQAHAQTTDQGCAPRDDRTDPAETSPVDRLRRWSVTLADSMCPCMLS